MSDLVEAGRAAREQAYAPYSGYRVGAAVRGADGRIWSGCNVENASYPMSMCAERNAVAEMVAAGERQVVEVAVVTANGGFPCGGCLQVLLEFSPDPSQVVVHAVAENGRDDTYRLSELIPHGFRLAED